MHSDPEFEDALDDFPNIAFSRPTLEQSMNEVSFMLDMALNNQFEEALNMADKWYETSLYHALGKATLNFFKGVLTMEHSQIQNTMDALKHCINLYQTERYQMSAVSRVMWGPNYNQYTEGEVHAELIYAEAQLLAALMTFLQDQNLVSLVKGAFKIRSCYQSYKECNLILNQRVCWANEKSKRNFESGVRMGIGTFNLMISHLPGKVLRLLEFVGFSGNRKTGFEELERATEMSDGLRSPLAKFIMLVYYCYVEHLFGLGNEDLTSACNLLKTAMKTYPNSVFFILFTARIRQIKGEVDDAIIDFERCISIQNQWKQVHNICYWELLWCYCIKGNWEKAVYLADKLRLECAWSPATYAFQGAVFRYMIYLQNGKEEYKTEAIELLKKVPSLRIRYAGKTIPAEKFAISTSERMISGEKAILLPAYEFMYIWNIWAILDKHQEAVNPILYNIESTIKNLPKIDSEDTDTPMDSYLGLTLLKGMCLRSLNKCEEAERCFLEVIEFEKRLAVDTYLAPHASFELGMTHVKMSKIDTACEWLEKAKRDYSGYLLETMVHFKVHCATRNIKVIAKEIANGVISSDSDESLNSISQPDLADEAKEVEYVTNSLQKLEPVIKNDICSRNEEITVNL